MVTATGPAGQVSGAGERGALDVDLGLVTGLDGRVVGVLVASPPGRSACPDPGPQL